MSTEEIQAIKHIQERLQEHNGRNTLKIEFSLSKLEIDAILKALNVATMIYEYQKALQNDSNTSN